jgi:putative PEP-CTERM system histidine kinase
MNALSTVDLICAVAYLGLALLLALHSERRAHARLLVAACAATGLWSLGLVSAREGLVGPVPEALLDVLRLGLWVAFVATACREGNLAGHSSTLRVPVLVCAASGLVLVGVALAWPAPSSALLMAWLHARLAFTVCGLVLIEAVVRQARAPVLWRVRYLGLGVGAIFVYELFVWSDALLFWRVDAALVAARAGVSLIAVPLVGAAAARNPHWSTELRLARRAVVHGAALIAVGVYLIALAAVGALLRSHGGEWGGVLSPAFLVAGAVLLGALATSTATRSRLKAVLGRYLFTHRHDYREQWQRFAEALGSSRGPSNPAARALQALAGVLGSERGGLWLRELDGFVPLAWLGLADAEPAEVADARCVEELERDGDRVRVVVADPEAPVSDDGGWLPAALRAVGGAWLRVPLAQRGRPIGFALLSAPGGRRVLAAEDEELLRSAALHAASYLAAEQTARELDEARRFEALSRSLAFIAHDLRNLANELTLTLANARRHIQSPEFQRDLMLSMDESVARMQRLLDRLAERKPPPPAVAEAEVVELVERALRGRAGTEPVLRLEVDAHAPVRVACDPDRLASMSGHLVQNAIEAAGPAGHVVLRVRREGDECVLEVVDDGPGMSDAFLRERLRYPFRSSKRNGMGLGLYECRELARQAGGTLHVESAPGRGTVARLRLPLLAATAHATARPDGAG